MREPASLVNRNVIHQRLDNFSEIIVALADRPLQAFCNGLGNVASPLNPPPSTVLSSDFCGKKKTALLTTTPTLEAQSLRLQHLQALFLFLFALFTIRAQQDSKTTRQLLKKNGYAMGKGADTPSTYQGRANDRKAKWEDDTHTQGENFLRQSVRKAPKVSILHQRLKDEAAWSITSQSEGAGVEKVEVRTQGLAGSQKYKHQHATNRRVEKASKRGRRLDWGRKEWGLLCNRRSWKKVLGRKSELGTDQNENQWYEIRARARKIGKFS